MKNIVILFIGLVLIMFACGDDPVEGSLEVDCAGVPGGNAMLDSCGTCDDDPTNDCNPDCLQGGEDICGCTDMDAINYDPNATLDDGTCQYYSGQIYSFFKFCS